MTAEATTATIKERFDLLLSGMIRFQERFVDTGFKVAAALTVFLGWLLTAQSAQTFIKTSHYLLWTACLLVACVGTTVVLFSMCQARSEAERLFTKLCELRYMEKDYLIQHRLKPRLFWSVVLLNSIICALLVGQLVLVRFTS